MTYYKQYGNKEKKIADGDYTVKSAFKYSGVLKRYIPHVAVCDKEGNIINAMVLDDKVLFAKQDLYDNALPELPYTIAQRLRSSVAYRGYYGRDAYKSPIRAGRLAYRRDARMCAYLDESDMTNEAVLLLEELPKYVPEADATAVGAKCDISLRMIDDILEDTPVGVYVRKMLSKRPRKTPGRCKKAARHAAADKVEQRRDIAPEVKQSDTATAVLNVARNTMLSATLRDEMSALRDKISNIDKVIAASQEAISNLQAEKDGLQRRLDACLVLMETN